MKKQAPQSSLVLRVLGGGYLVYLGWDLFSSSGGQVWFQLAAGAFAIVGAVLLGTSLRTLVKSGYLRDDPAREDPAGEEE